MFFPESAFERVREAVFIALDQLRANKFRSAMTILGIVIGVATVMIMGAAIAGIRGEIVGEIAAAGPRNFIVARFDYLEIQFEEEGPRWWDFPQVTAREAEAIAELDGVENAIVSFNISAGMKGPIGAPVDGVSIWARGPGWNEFTLGRFVAGHDFLPSDVASSRAVIIISKSLAEALFGRLDPLNRVIRVRGRPFTVIGVFEPKTNLFGDSEENFAVAPHTAVVKHLNAWTGFLDILVVTADGVPQSEAMDQVTATLRGMRGLRPTEPNNFTLIRQEQILDTFNRITGVFFIVMLGLSSVALLVGGVGVIAIMMISVTERTREIGVRKALGARRREILWQFLFEAMTLTVAGGVVGMLIGAAVAWLIQAVTPIPAAIQLSSVVAALIMAAIAGIAFGLFPAWRASRLDPVDALRYE